MLERVAALFPLNSHHPRDEVPRDLKDNLTVSQGDYYWSDSNAPRHIRGELGVFHFSRGQYVQALDEFLRADFWEDAAYVAERILSVDELKSYVDENWPLPSADSGQEEQANVSADEVREKIRYLRARRLTRMLRGDEAREYYPA